MHGLLDTRDLVPKRASVGQKKGHVYILAAVGSRPPMMRDVRHDCTYLFAAMCPDRGVGAAIIMPMVNTQAMNEHLKEVSTQVATCAHCTLSSYLDFGHQAV